MELYVQAHALIEYCVNHFFSFLSFKYVNFNYKSPHSILSLDFFTKHLICLWIPFLTQALHLFSWICSGLDVFCVDLDFNSISKDFFLSFFSIHLVAFQFSINTLFIACSITFSIDSLEAPARNIHWNKHWIFSISDGSINFFFQAIIHIW